MSITSKVLIASLVILTVVVCVFGFSAVFELNNAGFKALPA